MTSQSRDVAGQTGLAASGLGSLRPVAGDSSLATTWRKVRYAEAGSQPVLGGTSGTSLAASPLPVARLVAAARNHSRLPGWSTDSPVLPRGRSEESSATTGLDRKIRRSTDRISSSEA